MQLSDITPNVFPTYILDDCDSGLCLFGAGFYGRNDAIHMYNAGLSHVEVVDIDEEKLLVMKNMYPNTWNYSLFDVSEWLSIATMRPALTYDIVSIDAPTNLFGWVLGNFEYLAKLANKYLVVTMDLGLLVVNPYDYFRYSIEWDLHKVINRSTSGDVHLLVLTRGAAGVEAR